MGEELDEVKLSMEGSQSAGHRPVMLGPDLDLFQTFRTTTTTPNMPHKHKRRQKDSK